MNGSFYMKSGTTEECMYTNVYNLFSKAATT
jgi:hypothetical protein